ncbi:MAG: hypothetical protein KAT17_10055 [Candidatus Aminicenantes bacterium]|nr:hypothetical protein [Candidatus Aminicenantes bacterium]
MNKKISIILILFIVSINSFSHEKAIDHNLKVTIKPGTHLIKVRDFIHLQKGIKNQKVCFLLHKNLTITAFSKNIKIKKKVSPIRKFSGRIPIMRKTKKK